jgi:hypothetical protein
MPTVNSRFKSWDESVKQCASFNATLVELDSSYKEFIFLSYLRQSPKNGFWSVWLNGHKDSSGKWKWINSGKEITYNRWGSDIPTSDSLVITAVETIVIKLGEMQEAHKRGT